MKITETSPAQETVKITESEEEEPVRDAQEKIEVCSADSVNLEEERTAEQNKNNSNDINNDAGLSIKEITVEGVRHYAVVQEKPASEEDWVVKTKKSKHIHTWVDVTKTIHYEEKSHTEKRQTGTRTVVDQEAWDEVIKGSVAVCKKCGYTSEDARDVENHIADEHDCEASYTVKTITKETIHHDAVTHEEPVYEEVKVVDEEAWDEVVVVGQKCTGCGATR